MRWRLKLMNDNETAVNMNTSNFSKPKTIEDEVMGLISVRDLIKNIALIKEFATRKECNEQIYLCADHIEQELHKLIYNPNSFKLENDW